MKAVEVSFVVKEQVERFISKYPVLNDVVKSNMLHEFYNPEFCKSNGFPCTGLLKDVYQYLTGSVLETIEQEGLTILVYTQRNEVLNSFISCEVRNLKATYAK